MWFLKYSKQAHKHACLSLYKALLTHAAHLPLSPQKNTTIAFIIRRKFRKSKNLQGGPLRTALQSAYEAEALLRRACQKHGPSITAVTQRLSDLKLEHAQKVVSTFMPKRVVVKPPTPPSQLAPKRKKKILALTLKPREKAIRSARVRARPPIMGHTNGLPILKRPGRRIPQWVSVIINKKIKKGVREVDALNHLKDNVLYYAQMEDAWDAGLLRSGLLGQNKKDSVTWSDGARECLIILRAHYRASELKTYQITSRFQEIIDQARVQYRVRLRERRIQKRAWRKQQLINEMEGKLAGIQKEWKATKAQKVPPIRSTHSNRDNVGS